MLFFNLGTIIAELVSSRLNASVGGSSASVVIRSSGGFGTAVFSDDMIWSRLNGASSDIFCIFPT